MPFPTHYFDETGMPVEGAAGAESAFDEAVENLVDKRLATTDLRARDAVAAAIRALELAGMAVTLKADPYPGQVARVRIDAYGESASEVEATLLEYATRCDAAVQQSEVSYGECVIERNLEEAWGETYSWRGRLILHPTIGTVASSTRAAQAAEAAA